MQNTTRMYTVPDAHFYRLRLFLRCEILTTFSIMFDLYYFHVHTCRTLQFTEISVVFPVTATHWFTTEAIAVVITPRSTLASPGHAVHRGHAVTPVPTGLFGTWVGFAWREHITCQTCR